MWKEIFMTDVRSDTSDPSAPKVLLESKEEIERQWAAAVRQQIASASQLEDPILFNYFPGLLQRLAEALEPESKRIDALEGNTSAQEHGGERARMTNFNISQIATEFYLLKETIHNVMGKKIQLNHHELSLIDRSIDRALQESITAFALAESYIREQFIAMLAHDIRGPIAFIKMATSLLLEGVEANVALDLHQRIADAAESAGSLIDNILDASVIKATKRIKLGISHCHIHDIIRKAIRAFHENIVLEGPDVEGYWCPRGLYRALHNLIENAVKYGDPDQPIVVKVDEAHGGMHLAVHNKGRPIPMEERENIFQPFHRSHAGEAQDIKGWGFGLPIVRGIVEAHGGSIDVDSTAALGTTITMALPIDARPYQNSLTLG
jgi:signal transduction histidine kinase